MHYSRVVRLLALVSLTIKSNNISGYNHFHRNPFDFIRQLLSLHFPPLQRSAAVYFYTKIPFVRFFLNASTNSDYAWNGEDLLLMPLDDFLNFFPTHLINNSKRPRKTVFLGQRKRFLRFSDEPQNLVKCFAFGLGKNFFHFLHILGKLVVFLPLFRHNLNHPAPEINDIGIQFCSRITS